MKATGLPYLLRLTAGRTPASLIGLFTSITLILMLTGVFLLESIPLKIPNYSSNIYVILTIGYVVFVTRVIYKNHLKGFDKLLSVSKLGEEKKHQYRSQMLDFRPFILETLVALVIGFLHAYYMASLQYLFDGTARFPFLSAYSSFGIILIWLVITHSTAISLRNMRLLNKLSKEIEIDILNIEHFMPLTKSGVISILGFIGAYSILLIQDIGALALKSSSILPLFTHPALFPLIPTIIWMLFTPLKGLRKRVNEAKANEIQLIDEAIEGNRDALEESRICANLENINVIDLINYKKMVQNTLEIPVNIPTASRFIFYLIIPILTWIASSMVDKTLDLLF